MPSAFITKLMAFPPSAHAPKQCHVCRAGDTWNEGVFSLWKGQQHVQFAPRFVSSGTYSRTSETMSDLSSIALIVSWLIILI